MGAGAPVLITFGQAGITFGQASKGLSDVWPWLAALAAFVIVGGIVLSVVRRQMMTKDEDVPGTGFTLHDLRQLHARGDLTDVEFKTAKAALIERIRDDESEKILGGPGTGIGGI